MKISYYAAISQQVREKSTPTTLLAALYVLYYLREQYSITDKDEGTSQGLIGEKQRRT